MTGLSVISYGTIIHQINNLLYIIWYYDTSYNIGLLEENQ